MNVANKDLCAELEKLSGWDDTIWFHFRDKLWTSHEIRGKTMSEDNHAIAAYDLGYLLRKLPKEYRRTDNEIEFSLMLDWCDGAWVALYTRGTYRLFDSNGTESPEDAVAMLAIELFKQGVLAKGAKQ